MLYIVLIVIVLAVVGALLHPFVLLLGLLPGDASRLLQWLTNVMLFVSAFVFWSFFSLLSIAVVIVLKSRLAGRKVFTSSEARAANSVRDVDPNTLKVVVAITAYNDAEATAMAVQEFRAQRGVAEVIVIDNNSTDDTVALAAAAGARVIQEPHQGYGYTCIRGLAEALRVPEADVIVLTEGDGTFVAADLSKFLAYIHQADMVIGTRVVPGLVDRESQMDPFFIWGNVAVSLLLRLRFWDTQFLGAVRLSDVGCTFRAIRRDALEQILPDLVVGGSHFSAHMILVTLNHRLSIIEIPITFRRRIGSSKGGSRSLWAGLAVGLSMIWHIVTYNPRVSPTS